METLTDICTSHTGTGNLDPESNKEDISMTRMHRGLTCLDLQMHKENGYNALFMG
jgi:hypothetical protein